MAEVEKTKKLHPIVMLNYVPRFTGHAFGVVLALLALVGQGRPIANAILFAVLEGIIWPHVALFLSMRSKNPKPLELKLLFLDSYWVGLWIAYIDFSIWPTFAIVCTTFMANISVQGLRLGLQSLVANALGAFTIVFFRGFQFYPQTDLITSILSASFIILFSSVMGYMTYYRAKITKGIREKLRQAYHELDQINKILKEASASLELDNVMKIIFQTLKDVFKFDFVTIQIPQENKLAFRSVYGNGNELGTSLRESLYQVHIDSTTNSLSGRAFAEKQTIFYQKKKHEHTSLSDEDKEIQNILQCSSMTYVPILIQDRVIAVIGFYTRQFMEINERILKSIKFYIMQVSLIINNALLYDQIKSSQKEKDHLISELKDSRDNLEQSLLQLQQSRAQLVQSEKMAGIGQLIAGISHEINTPAGAIASAIEEINTDYVSLLEKLITIVDNLDPKLKQIYFEVCSMTLKIPNEYGTMEIRSIASEIQKVLAEHEIDDSRTLSRNLATIGFKEEHIPKLIPLFTSSLSTTIHDSMFMLGMTRIHTRDIQIAIQKILNLVKALKLFSRSDQGELIETNLAEDIVTTLVILHNRLKHGITVVKEFEAIPLVECVAERLNQVWLNMINNAIEAMKGKGKIIIRIKLWDEHHVSVEFEDNGPGIPQDVLPRIFEAYYTTKPKGEGTGLGLYISNEIIMKHSGKIEIDTKSTGTLFRIILPIKGNIKDEQR